MGSYAAQPIPKDLREQMVQSMQSAPDDNAFTDCAIAAHADYVITEDRHFAPLANAGYKPQPITPEAFIERYRGVHVL